MLFFRHLESKTQSVSGQTDTFIDGQSAPEENSGAMYQLQAQEI